MPKPQLLQIAGLLTLLGACDRHRSPSSSLPGKERTLDQRTVDNFTVTTLATAKGKHSTRDGVARDHWGVSAEVQISDGQSLWLGTQQRSKSEVFALLDQVQPSICVDETGRFPRVGVGVRSQDWSSPFGVVFLYSTRAVIVPQVSQTSCADALRGLPNGLDYLESQLDLDLLRADPAPDILHWSIAVEEDLFGPRTLQWALASSKVVGEQDTLQREPIKTLSERMIERRDLRDTVWEVLRPGPSLPMAFGTPQDKAGDLALTLLSPSMEAHREEWEAAFTLWKDVDVALADRWKFSAVMRLGVLGGQADCDRVLDGVDGLLDRHAEGYDTPVREALHAVRSCASPDRLRATALRALVPPTEDTRVFQAGACKIDDPTDLCDTSMPLEAAQILAPACDEGVVAAARIALDRPERTVAGAGSCLLAICAKEKPTDELPLRWFCPSAI